MTLQELSAQGLVLLGCGKMGSALLQGWLEGGLPAQAVTVLDPKPSDWLRGTGVALNTPLPENPALALIAVKPQMMGEALPALKALPKTTVLLSIAAGTPLSAFEATFGAETPIIRAMPNTPAAVAQGITAVFGNPQATEAQLVLAETLLSAVGEVVRLDNEGQMDAVTGVSGSGPAYVFHMVEALALAARDQGLPPELAMKLARQTVAGAGALLAEAPESAEQLRVNVTSPNGTTQAGLEVLMPDLPDLITRTVTAAAERSRELAV